MPLICALSEECLTHTTFSGVIQLPSSGTQRNKDTMNQQFAQSFRETLLPRIHQE